MNTGNVPELRRLLADAPFSPDQRRYLDDLLNRWEQSEDGG